MPLLCGPCNSRFTYTGSKCPHLGLAIQSDARTVAEALEHYERHFSVKIAPMVDPLHGLEENRGKYFQFWQTLDSDEWRAVDVHIIREGLSICTKHELHLQPRSEDIVEIGELIC
jgi:hypothetical protein